MKRALLVLLLMLAWALPLRAEEAADPEEQSFLQDLTALSSGPHRLSGTEQGAHAARHIESRLRSIASIDVFTLGMPVWQATTARCQLEVGGVTVPLAPLRPNVMVPPVTPEGGLVAPLIYVGRGEAADYGARSPVGKIVVLDYDSFDNWQRAFSLGAKAVIFLGRGDETSIWPKHADVPVNQIRLYARADELHGVDLTADHDEVVLHSEVRWEVRSGKNVVARIRGSAPGFAGERPEPEALVLAANYDSFGVVPERTPGARGAANVAALLEAAARFAARPPKRDLILAFLDNQGRGHQGARELYDALGMSSEQSARLAEQHRTELGELTKARDLLRSQGLSFSTGDAGLRAVVHDALSQTADFRRDDVKKRIELLRLSKAAGESERRALHELDQAALRWDELRRALHVRELGSFVTARRGDGAYAPLFEELVAQTVTRFERRIAELVELSAIDVERERLRAGLSRDGKAPWIVLHASYDLSDRGATWGAVAGDYTLRLFSWRAPKPEGDAPGFYGRVLNALREAGSAAPPLSGLDLRSLGDPTLGASFAPQPFVSSGAIAGTYGIYNLTFTTGYDARPRDGHPADTLEALDWGALRRQARAVTELLARAADSKDLSLPRVFKDLAVSKYPSYAGGRASGDYAGLQVSGRMREDRPAAGALLALWPGNKNWNANAWITRAGAGVTSSFEPTVYERVDERGCFRVVGLREDVYTEVMAIGALFDERGAVRAISTQEQQAHKIRDAMRVNLFTGPGYSWTLQRTFETQPQQLKVLKASSDAPFRENRSLFGQLEDHGFAYVSDQIVDYRLKLFQPMGPVALGEFSAEQPDGTGLPASSVRPGLALRERAARDLWALNEQRLGKLRARGVTSADLEILHSRARQARDEGGTAPTVALKEAALQRSSALSHRVYQPLRLAMDDLVHAIVVLLLLAIPFAFALERLTFCATTIYGRILGFTGCFLATFALLYWLHPGFAIAATPVIIFLAFAIVLLSALVIYIVARKFKTELFAMQGQSAGVHDLEVSRMGTLLAAVGMGVSTMRRRPTRTLLTAVTVVMLTFTILCFASFSRTVGVRAIYEGPAAADTPYGVLIRKLDYGAMLPAVLDMLHGTAGEEGRFFGHYWLAKDPAESRRLSIARRDDGRAVGIDAVMGLPGAELERWEALGRALGSQPVAEKRAALESGGVYLPAVVAEVLELTPGDPVLLAGHPVVFAGVTDAAALQRLRHLDGQSVLPVDFQDVAALAAGSRQQAQASENELLMADEADRDFVHLSSEQVAVASSDLTRRLGGALHAITAYPGPEVVASELGRRLAEVVTMPVWAAGDEGVERLLLTVLTEVSGGFALFVPLLLGGLIIFGTLLGSISDREKEIYTFSALGLSPGHVGVLFFAEAAVYAVVGGMGGQILAQLVGVAASYLAKTGRIEPTSINYSSTNSLFAIGIVMLTVLVSAIYPALRASRSANPGLSRSWKMPPAHGDELALKFPFTVSAYDITGVVSFLAEHFRRHDDAGLGDFAASEVRIGKTSEGRLELSADLALAPFDLGVTQHLSLTAVPSEIEGVDEVALHITRTSGAISDWYRANRVFLRGLRRQFLLWRTLSSEMIEQYRLETLQALGAAAEPVAKPESVPAAKAEMVEA